MVRVTLNLILSPINNQCPCMLIVINITEVGGENCVMVPYLFELDKKLACKLVGLKVKPRKSGLFVF